MSINTKSLSDKLIREHIYPNLKGFQYIIEAVEHYKPGEPIMPVYNHVAQIHEAPLCRIEKAIRHAKERSPVYGKYTNAEFIALLKLEQEREEGSE